MKKDIGVVNIKAGQGKVPDIRAASHKLQLTVISPNCTKFLSECVQTSFQVGHPKACVCNGG